MGLAGKPDYYRLLGVPRDASPEEIRRAYRQAALRLHPDKNVRPGETELFININEAYEVLSDPARRAQYDQELAEQDRLLEERAAFRCQVLHSRRHLLRLDEPQVHYMLLEIMSNEKTPKARPPINLCLVVDRSTSMRGQRLDQVRNAALAILRSLEPEDRACLIAFSDRAEVVISPDQARDFSVARARLSFLQAGGGTEIGQGLALGLEELRRYASREAVNHLILLTDGRTYGDEKRCLEMASQAASEGITINGVGIGSDWSDRFLDDLAGRTGGHVVFLDTPRAIADLLARIFDDLGKVVAARVRLEGQMGQHVDLRSAFRLLPEPMPLVPILPFNLGHLPREGRIQVLLELVIHPVGSASLLPLADLEVTGDLLAKGSEGTRLPLSLSLPVSEEPDTSPPPEPIVAALGAISLYQMQEKARHEAELGQPAQAARRLENLATHLLAGGQRDLAKAALLEAERLMHTQRLSAEGEKLLKYGTRALLLPPPRSQGS